ncbi:MAG: septal ring lytic transglycosylase RlpA family lipoprotein [Deltaproteobacteria bacterium]|nr:MAG: septal ring lytic transglycosylase RlpA family lipoprotein [Deltaproteobacteria bacterium]
MKKIIFHGTLLLLCALCLGCMHRQSSHFDYSLPEHPRLIKSQEGIASWYGRDFHGKRTSNGDIYDMNKLTAAHKELPLGSRVRVTNLENRRQVDVLINDRGPFVRGRIIDLSYAAAKALDMVDQGTALVRITLLSPPPSMTKGKESPAPSSSYYGVQAGSFARRENARQLYEKLQVLTQDVFMETTTCGGRTCYQVRAGWFVNRRQAEELARRFKSKGFEAIIITQDHN